MKTIHRCLILLFLLAGCTGTPPTPPPPRPSPTTGVTPSPTVPPTRQPTASLDQLTLGIDPAVPVPLADLFVDFAVTTRVSDSSAADFWLGPAAEDAGSCWIFALVAPFPTVVDGVSLAELQSAWQGQPPVEFAGEPILLTPATRLALEALWGPPAAGAVQELPGETEIRAQAWQNRPAWAVLPFEALNPEWKVLRLDDQSPYDPAFDPMTYPLKVNFSLQLSEAARQALPGLGLVLPTLPGSNRDPEKLTIVVVTGTTAIVRTLAARIDEKGIDYPADLIRDWLISADITHISNESSFTPDCPVARWTSTTRMFCSSPEHVALFHDVGADVIELSGNHLGDYGAEPIRYTLELLAAEGFLTYASGINQDAARQGITLEHHGNRIAFIGCNEAGPDYVWATPTRPGAAQCDMDWLALEVERLRTEGYLPIVTFQYRESQGTHPMPWEIRDFRRMVDAGAVIVSGSQSHVPMTMEFYNGGFVHYGLGNLFFDQMTAEKYRQEVIDRHIFYDGVHLGSELLTAYL
ncbi:MAG TPA: CapA family protein, partial [Anaerolineaceae bacterium]|nr:CapA family protein [Anaerolineaceae bacterium]